MFRPESSSQPASPIATAPAHPPAVAASAVASNQVQFSSVMQGLRREIEDFIQRGSADNGFTVSGQVYRMRQLLAARRDADAGGPAAEASAAPAPRRTRAESDTAAIRGPEKRRHFELRPLNAAFPSESGVARILSRGDMRTEHRPLSGSAPSSLARLSMEQRQFLDMIHPYVREAAGQLGVAPELVAAQAALESGWGQHPLRDHDGADTHNLFGLKAGSSWRGKLAEITTTEFENGLPIKRVERFRSYSDLAGAFQDFTRLLLNAPRYRSALNTGADAAAYAQALVKGGYATDPSYADKLIDVVRGLQSR